MTLVNRTLTLAFHTTKSATCSNSSKTSYNTSRRHNQAKQSSRSCSARMTVQRPWRIGRFIKAAWFSPTKNEVSVLLDPGLPCGRALCETLCGLLVWPQSKLSKLEAAQHHTHGW
jgi:hypothetical protein